MNKKMAERKFNDLKQQLADAGMPIPGSIQTSYLRCGKKKCRCQQSDDNRHGPYYLWYRREKQKLKTQSIAEQDVQLYREWIRNRETIEMLVRKMVELGAQYATNINCKPKKNSKKTSS